MSTVFTPNHALPIDTDFDVPFANRIAYFETYNKHHYRPNTYLHKWWGRRCGSTFRLILKGLVEDSERIDYYAPGGLEGKLILDPMMGGGTTIHEAIRLGANVIGIDLDPIPVLQARATLTQIPLGQILTSFDTWYSDLLESNGSHYLTHCPRCQNESPMWYGLYGLKRRCNCHDVLFVDSLVLRYQTGTEAIRLCPRCGELTSSREHECSGKDYPYIVEKNQLHCIHCQGKYKDRLDLPYFERYELLGIAGHCPQHDFFLKSPDGQDRELLQLANKLRQQINLPASEFEVKEGDKTTQLVRREITNYLDLFSSRQLLFLENAIAMLPDNDQAIRLNLALLLSTSLEFNSLLCGYKGTDTRRAGAVRHAFSHHGYSFPYTALEVNPLYPRKASGTLQKLFHGRIERGRRWAVAPKERIIEAGNSPFAVIQDEHDSGYEVSEVESLSDGTRRFYLHQSSATQLPIDDDIVDAVITDPPYFDSIQYGDLSAFFRVWLKRMLPDDADWDYDQELAAVNPENSEGIDHYVRLMERIFQECRRVLRPGTGRLIFTFHHWKPRAWAALTVALYQSEFRLYNRYIVHAEHPISVHINNMRALTHDAIMVFAPREAVHHFPWADRRSPRPIDTQRQDSEQFAEACASYLGWILEQPGLEKEEIQKLWTDYLDDNNRES